MPKLIKYITPALNFILMQELFFLSGVLAATQLGWLFQGKTLIVMAITILPLLVFVLMFAAAYKIVTRVINHYYADISRTQKIVLTVTSLLSILIGFWIAL